MEPKRGPGRPPGSRNKERLRAPSNHRAFTDYQSDPMTLISRQFVLIDKAQLILRADLFGPDGENGVLDESDVERLLKLSNALARSIDALRKASDALEVLSTNLTPEQLLEAALKKIESQDVGTISHAIRRLRSYRAMVTNKPDTLSAADDLAALDAE